MCKRHSPDKNEASTGCVRETTQISKKRRQHGMCQRNSPDKNEGSTGYVRETPLIKTKSAWDVYEKFQA